MARAKRIISRVKKSDPEGETLYVLVVTTTLGIFSVYLDEVNINWQNKK